MENLPQNQPDETPFSEPLLRSKLLNEKVGNRLKELESNPNKIIRSQNLESLFDGYGIEAIKLVRIAKKLYGELETVYGISVPVEFLIGKDKGGRGVVYSIVDKVQGSTIDKVVNKTKAADKIEALYTSIAKYLLDKFKNGGFYLTDINGPSQYVFGKKPGDEEEKVYLVDPDIYMHNKKAGIYTVVEWLVRHMSYLEDLYQTRFEKAREYIGKTTNEPLPEKIDGLEKERIENNLSQIKKFLACEPMDESDGPAIPSFFMDLDK